MAAKTPPEQPEATETKRLITWFTYDRDTVREAEILQDNGDGTLDLQVEGLMAQAFVTNASSPPAARVFLKVRKGTHKGDVGTYFQEEA